jgi:hypothetical protein
MLSLVVCLRRCTVVGSTQHGLTSTFVITHCPEHTLVANHCSGPNNEAAALQTPLSGKVSKTGRRTRHATERGAISPQPTTYLRAAVRLVDVPQSDGSIKCSGNQQFIIHWLRILHPVQVPIQCHNLFHHSQVPNTGGTIVRA